METLKEIEKMKTAEKFSKRLRGYKSWFEDYLMKLARTIERHFMLDLRHRFNPLFRDWFNLLIEDELTRLLGIIGSKAMY